MTFLTFSEWLAIAEIYPSEKDFQFQIAEASTGGGSIELWTRLVQRSPSCTEFVGRLATACEKGGLSDTEVQAWKTLVIEHPDYPIFWDRLELACTELEDRDSVVMVWTEIANTLPELPEPLCRLARILR